MELNRAIRVRSDMYARLCILIYTYLHAQGSPSVIDIANVGVPPLPRHTYIE